MLVQLLVRLKKLMTMPQLGTAQDSIIVAVTMFLERLRRF
jgi:hypothetical protein